MLYFGYVYKDKHAILIVNITVVDTTTVVNINQLGKKNEIGTY